MTPLQEQLIALGAVFEAAALVDRIARTGQAPNAAMASLLGSLLVREEKPALDIYGGDDLNLREGYRALVGALERDTSSLQREPLRYALAMIGLERQLDKRSDMLQVIGSRLDQIQAQADHFGLTHENVIASFGGLYQDTLSTFRQRIQVQETCVTCNNQTTPPRSGPCSSPAFVPRAFGVSLAAIAGR